MGPVFSQGSQKVFDNYVYVEDTNAESPAVNGTGTSFELHSFPANTMTNFDPPDPTMAVGPDHIVTSVNMNFSIWDREGNLLKNIDGVQWFSQVAPAAEVYGDPQVIYDHYENRWFFLFMGVNDGTLKASNLICYSDDENPLGTWYMYRLDTKKHGTVNSNTWGDYPHVGYDDQAIYITTNCFSFSNSFYYSKIRIINKSELYAAEGGPLTYTDFWNITLPNSSQKPISIQPAVSYTPGYNTGYFAWNNSSSSNIYVLYKITNPITNPVLSGVTMTISPPYYPPPRAKQLGGGTLIANLPRMTSVPVLRDGKLYAAHAIRNTQYSAYGSLKYFVIDVNNNSVVEQVEQGAQGYYYIFPSITVDKDHNIGITYSRSGETEYVGAYYSTKLSTDPPGLSPSKVMMEGQGNYNRFGGNAVQRWGDYFAAGLDPVNQYNIWFFSEYAAATNQWRTWLTEIRMKPYAGAFLYTKSNPIEFGELEIGSNPITKIITISNYGDSPLIINNIDSPVGPFTLLTSLSYPVTLNTYDSLDLEIEFNPVDPAIYSELMVFDNNDSNFDGLTLNGNGFVINPAYTGALYATTGAAENGVTITIDKTTGNGTVLGYSNFDNLNSITADPVTSILYGETSTSTQTMLVRINGAGGDGFIQYSLGFGDAVGVTFDSSGTLYVATQIGNIYTVDLSDGSYSLVATANIQLAAVEIDPSTNIMYAVKKIVIGSGKDNIHTIDLTTGEATLVGLTGFGVKTNDLAFDENGDLYGVIGADNEVGQILKINKNDGTGTLIGDVNFMNVLGLAYAVNGSVSSINPNGEETSLPNEFALLQNYPNPFNPNTVIKFSVPVASEVSITIYNLLGQKVNTLINSEVTPGSYNVEWNGTDNSGMKVSSGIYLYKLKANGSNGRNFTQIKKMVLLK
ncbi:flagellar basal body rod modification protein [bacterium BMS3Abin03]|nr:flagellar basal body rod modification protein [bacterium BMS3Abin03]